MLPDAVQDTEQPAAPASPASPDQASLSSLWHAFTAVIDDFAGLLALEGRLAGISAAAMLALGVAAGLLAFSGWLFLIGAGVVIMVQQGYSWPALLLLAAVAHFGLAVAAVLVVRRLSSNLLFRATRRSLNRKEPGDVAAQQAQP